jgi:two-component system, LytTR family, response regulator
MKIRTILIDDEPLARLVVREYLEAHPEFEIICECNDGYEGMKAIQEHHPDLVFLDIQMPKINGFELLEVLDPVPPVIFTTAFDEYALKAFEANAMDYLLKPFSRERFDKALNRWKSIARVKPIPDNEPALSIAQPEEKNRIVVRFGGQIRIIPSADIFYMEAYDDYVKIFTRDDYFLKKKTLSHYELALDPSKFMRVHRSFLVNLNYLTRIEPYEKNSHVAVLKDGRKVPLSRSGYVKIRELLGL